MKMKNKFYLNKKIYTANFKLQYYDTIFDNFLSLLKI